MKGKKLMAMCISVAFLLVLVIPFFTHNGETELTSQDFSGLSYTDPKGDQYTYYRKEDAETNEIVESYGVKGKHSKSFDIDTSAVDITKLSATLDSGTVTIILELAGNVLYGGSLIYKVYFVESTHQHPDDLVDTDKFIETMLMKFTGEQTIFSIELEHDDSGNWYAYSWPELPSLTGNAIDNIITFTVSTSDLESMGLTTGSGFGLYAVCALHGVVGFGTGYLKTEVTWDTAGVGAASAPEEFNTDSYGGKDDGDDSEVDPVFAATCVIVIIVVIAIIILFGVRYMRKKDNVPPIQPE